MRAYVHITADKATLYLPGTSNRPADTVDVTGRFATMRNTARLANAGHWYRASAIWCNGWDISLGRPVDHKAEALRLAKLDAKGVRGSRTSSPGIRGFMQREAASTAAAHNQQQVSRHFAELLAREGAVR